MLFESGKFTKLAQVGKPIGLSGMCRIIPLGETLKNAKMPFKLYIGGGREVDEIELISISEASKGVLKGKFRDINDRDSVDLLKNKNLYIETDNLPATDDDEFYFHELEGLSVVTENGEEWGKVISVYNFPTTDAIEIQKKSGKKILFPFRKETTQEVNLTEKKIIIEQELLDDLL